MKAEKTSKRKKILSYVILAISTCLLIAAIVLTVYFVTDAKKSSLGGQNPATPVVPDDPDEPQKPDDKDPEVPSTGDDVIKFSAPLSYQIVSDYNAIYTSATTNFIYRHKAIDFVADEGTAVGAVADGVIESISLNEKTGNIITVNHGNGLKSLYRFVEPTANLKVGANVKRGEKIGEVAAAYGSEGKDGTHLHLEMTEQGKYVDPAKYLDIEYDEK